MMHFHDLFKEILLKETGKGAYQKTDPWNLIVYVVVFLTCFVNGLFLMASNSAYNSKA